MRDGGMAFVKSLLYFVVPFLFSVNETEAAVYEVIDWIGSNTGKPSHGRDPYIIPLQQHFHLRQLLSIFLFFL
jgi:hypothetical protein